MAENRLAKLLIENAEKGAQRRCIIDRLRSFLQVQRHRIPERFRNSISRLQKPEAVTVMEEPNSEILTSPSSIMFTETVHSLLEFCSSGLAERRAAINEKRAGMRILLTDISGGDETGGGAKAMEVKCESDVLRDYKRGLYRSRTLLIELDRRDHRLNTERTNAGAELELANRAREELEEKLIKLTEQSKNEAKLAAKKIDELERQLADRTKQDCRLRCELQKLAEFIEVVKVELDDHRRRSKALERARTIGYVDQEVKPAVNQNRIASCRRQTISLPLLELRSLRKTMSNDDFSSRREESSRRKTPRKVTFVSNSSKIAKHEVITSIDSSGTPITPRRA